MRYGLAATAGQDPGRIAHGRDVVAEVVEHHGTRAYRRPFADLYFGDHDGSGTDVRAFAYFYVPAQGDVRGNVGEVADAVIVIDAGGRVHQYMTADDGVGLNDGTVQDHRAFADGGGRGNQGRWVTGDPVAGSEHFDKFGAFGVAAHTENYGRLEGGEVRLAGEPDAGLDVLVERVPVSGAVVENPLDANALTP